MTGGGGDTTGVELAAPAPRDARPGLDAAALGVGITSVVAVSLIRAITLGFVPVAPDDALYIGVGRSLWALREPLGINGAPFTIRSWVYPLMTGGASRLIGDDPFTGPRLLGWTLATLALVLAVVFAFRLARGVGAIATALAILAAPVIWRSVTTTRVEVALICSLMVLLLVMGKPTPRRMVIGGVVAGLTLLIKETSAPLVILPLAYLGTVSRAEWRRLATRYLVGFVITVGWWFVTVYLLAGEIFPLEGIRHASDSALQRSWSLNEWAQLLIAAFVAGWLVVAIGRRHDPVARLLVLAGVAFVPAAVVAWAAGYGLRQFVPIALLSCIAFGVAGADVLTAATRRAPRGTPGVAVALLVIVAVMAVPVVLTQSHTTIEAVDGDDLDVELGQFFRGLPGEPSALTTAKFNVQLWARASGDASFRRLRFDNEVQPPALDDALWIDTSAHGFTSMPRRNVVRRFPDADYLVLSGPHTYGPIALATWLQEHGKDVGLIPVAHFGGSDGGAWAYVFRVDKPDVGAIPTIITSSAVERLAADGGFHPTGPTAVAATGGWLGRSAADHPPDGPEPYEPLIAPPR